MFSETELKAGKTTCVIGNTVSKELLGGEDALGKKLRLGSFSCDVIGVLEPKGQSMMGNDQDDVIIMPTKTVQRRLTGS